MHGLYSGLIWTHGLWKVSVQVQASSDPVLLEKACTLVSHAVIVSVLETQAIMHYRSLPQAELQT